jgi:ammonia channel protein AmtB
MLWGYPAAAPGPEGEVGWFTTPDGWPMINPLGNFLGAIIMFFVLGFLPGFVVAKILDKLGWLRVPPAVEAAGLDTHLYGDGYPYFEARETEFEPVERAEARKLTVSGDGASAARREETPQ